MSDRRYQRPLRSSPQLEAWNFQKLQGVELRVAKIQAPRPRVTMVLLRTHGQNFHLNNSEHSRLNLIIRSSRIDWLLYIAIVRFFQFL